VVTLTLVVLLAIATGIAIILTAVILSRLARAVIGGAQRAVRRGERRPLAREDEGSLIPLDEEPVPPFDFELGPEADGRTVEFHEASPESYASGWEARMTELMPATSPRDVRVAGEGDARMNDEASAYERLGEEVTAVLTAAEHAAAQVREAAAKEAEQKLLAAEENAAATSAEAQAVRTEADSYNEQTRWAADEYARAAREFADENAARIIAKAEDQARGVVAEAEEKADELTAAAARRQEALTLGAEDIEGRIESMLTSFRGVTSELEAMLASRRQAGEADESADEEPLDTALQRTAGGSLTRAHGDR
jgi:hypothetical protein